MGTDAHGRFPLRTPQKKEEKGIDLLWKKEPNLGVGIEFFISEKSAVNLDFKYIWTEVEGEVNKPGFTKEDFEINPFVIGLGIKYYF